MPPPPSIALPPPPDASVPLPPVVIVPAYGPLGVWFDADYLLWWTRSAHVPAIATSTVEAGAIGPATPQTLFDGGGVDLGARSGGRFAFGLWLQDSHVLGVEGTYLFLENHSVPLAFGLEDASDPTAPPGTFAVSYSSNLQGAEINLLANLSRSPNFRCELLGGFRFLDLEEKVHVVQDFISADTSEEDIWDDLCRTRNDFYGGQIGTRAEWEYDRFCLGLSGKVALGVTSQRVTFNGGLTQILTGVGTDAFGNPIETVQVNQSSNGGLVFQPATYSRDRFTVVPEVGVNLGYQFTSYLRGSLGYNFLYWSSVARAGDQLTGLPKATDFWVQGLTAGLSFRF